MKAGFGGSGHSSTRCRSESWEIRNADSTEYTARSPAARATTGAGARRTGGKSDSFARHTDRAPFAEYAPRSNRRLISASQELEAKLQRKTMQPEIVKARMFTNDDRAVNFRLC
jgi:hypothetical protein